MISNIVHVCNIKTNAFVNDNALIEAGVLRTVFIQNGGGCWMMNKIFRAWSLTY